MKNLFILSILFSIFLSCNKEEEPEPEPIRAYCNLFHFVPELESVIWEVDAVEVPDAKDYAEQFQGSIILESATEQINFTVKQSGNKEVLASQLLPLEQDKFYSIIVCGTTGNPSMFIREIETSRPAAGMVKFQAFHAAQGETSIDFYMGGSTADKLVVSDLDLFNFSVPFEVQDFDARAAITVSAHSEEYNQDSVLLSSIYNEGISSGASYLTVLAPSTFEPESDLTVWIYDLPHE
jgi:hypothetical protein